jgi:hypothetical protein
MDGILITDRSVIKWKVAEPPRNRVSYDKGKEISDVYDDPPPG